MPVFLRGRRAFCIIPAPPTSPRPTLIQSTASPIRALPTRTAPIRAAPATLRLPSATPTLTSPPTLRLPVTPTLTSPPPLLLPPATPFLTLPTSLSPPSDTEAPHGPQPLPLGLKCRHGPRMFSYPARSAATARASFAVLPGAPHGPCSFSCSTERRTADPRPCSARGTKKRTEPHRGPSAAKKQPICRGSITAAGLQPVRSVHAPETDPFRIVRAGISG